VARRRQIRQLRALEVPDAVVLDAEGLSAGAQGNLRVRAELTVAEALGARVHVSSVTLAEVLRRKPRDARVHLLLSGIEKAPVTAALGRAAGELLGRASRNDTVDAVVAVTARSVGQHVRLITADPTDLRALTADMPGVTVVPI
jgi:predicted nucleic acid-binding protein